MARQDRNVRRQHHPEVSEDIPSLALQAYMGSKLALDARAAWLNQRILFALYIASGTPARQRGTSTTGACLGGNNALLSIAHTKSRDG